MVTAIHSMEESTMRAKNNGSFSLTSPDQPAVINMSFLSIYGLILSKYYWENVKTNLKQGAHIHQSQAWPVPHACAQSYHPGSGSLGQLLRPYFRSSAWHSRRVNERGKILCIKDPLLPRRVKRQLSHLLLAQEYFWRKEPYFISIAISRAAPVVSGNTAIND